MHRPPPIARYLIGLAVRGDEKPFLLADLDEEYESISSSRGWRGAHRWYWSQVLRSVGPSLTRRITRGTATPSPQLRVNWFVGLSQDVRYALRGLLRTPTYSIVVILTLTFGIGSLAAVLSVVHSVLVEQLPFEAANELVLVREADVERGGELSRVSPPNFLDWRDQTGSFAELAAISQAGVILYAEDRAVQVPSMYVSAGFFPLLRVQPLQGRAFSRSDELDGANAVAVVSQAFWTRQFGDSEIQTVTADIVLNDVIHRVVGVLPDRFRYLTPVDVWLPLTLGTAQRDESMRGARYLDVVGRMMSGVDIKQTQERFRRLSEELAIHPNNAGWGISVTSLRDDITDDVALPITMLAVAVGFVVLVVIANLATLVMARATRQWQQVALKSALGATSMRLFRQTLVEHGLVAAIGAATGALLSAWTIDVLVSLAPTSLPDVAAIGFNGVTILVVIGSSVAVALILSLAAMLVTLKLSSGTFVRASTLLSENRSVVFVRNSLLVGEIAACIVLVIGAALLTQSFVRLRAVDPGFVSKDVYVGFVGLPSARYATSDSKAAYARRLRNALEQDATVSIAAVGTNLPMSGSSMDFGYRIEGATDTQPAQSSAQYHAVSAAYFSALSIPFIFGGSFDDRAESVPTVVVNETLARRAWGDQNPVGKRITVISQDGPTSREVVGVIGDIRHADPTAVPTDEVYVPFAQDPWSFFSVVARTKRGVDKGSVGRALDARMQVIDSRLPLNEVARLDDVVARWRAPLRFQMVLVGAFAVFALCLAGIGIYGVIAYFVSGRTIEIGVRLAVGADRVDILKLIVGKSLGLTVLGLVIGMGGAYLLSTSIEPLLFGVNPHDITLYAAAALTVVGLSIAASFLPARRASMVDPVRALRDT